ncbi:hypothetical protein ACJ73_07148 [Blastomyces percursus]|uniref:Uncharacterized protein n=1 Tax=Blastomyces percursus TaxID=1658174 RepID=A0A1J9R1M9_9EURO|nr:hypothetical protein ACJ73_07148 [Blastomyces percursus]
MASANSPRDGHHNTIIISSDAEMDEHQPSARKLRRKRPRTDYSYSVYEALFDDPAPSELWQPPKKRKILNLDTVLEFMTFSRRSMRRENLRAEMGRKDGLIGELETEVRELKHQCQCQICYTIPSAWRTLLCGHRLLPRVPSPHWRNLRNM